MKRYAKIAKSRMAKVGALVAVTAVTATNANAAATLTLDAIETGDYVLVAGVILVAGGVFYGLRKAIRLLG